MTKIYLHLALSRSPFPLWKYEEVSNTCSIFCRTAQLQCIAHKRKLVHYYYWSCLFCSALAVYQVQRVLTIICYCCTTYLLLCDECVPTADPPARLCIAHLFKQVLVCAALYCAMCNAQLCRREICAVCDKEYNCFITRLRRPILSLHQHVQFQTRANVCTCSGSCTMEAVLGKIKSGRGRFHVLCGPKMLQNERD